MAVPLVVLLSAAGYSLKPDQGPRVGTIPQYVAAAPTTLFGSGVASTDTSIRLSKLTTPNGTPVQTSDLVGGMTGTGSNFYGTIEPATTRKETVSCTGVTQNGDGSALLTGCSRGMSFTFPYLASTTLALPHSGGSAFVISNSPQLYNDIQTMIASSSAAGASDASQTVKGIVQLATASQAASHVAIGGGSTSAGLALYTAISSSTRTANTPQVVVASSTDGYIDASYIGASTLTGRTAVGLTLNGTTTISAPASTTDATGQQILYALVASSTLTANNSLWYIPNLPARAHYTMYFQAQGTSAANRLSFRFNGDSGQDYAFSSTTVSTQGDTEFSIASVSGTGTTTGVMDIWNNAGTNKYVVVNAWYGASVQAASSTNIFQNLTGGAWSTSTPQFINNITIFQTGGSIVQGSHVEIYASSF